MLTLLYTTSGINQSILIPISLRPRTQSLTINNVNFNLDYQDGKYGWNESSERGADTFHPFKNESNAVYINMTCHIEWRGDDTHSYEYTADEDCTILVMAYHAGGNNPNISMSNFSVIAIEGEPLIRIEEKHQAIVGNEGSMEIQVAHVKINKNQVIKATMMANTRYAPMGFILYKLLN